jgi:hypothetical protein
VRDAVRDGGEGRRRDLSDRRGRLRLFAANAGSLQLTERVAKLGTAGMRPQDRIHGGLCGRAVGGNRSWRPGLYSLRGGDSPVTRVATCVKIAGRVRDRFGPAGACDDAAVQQLF